MTVTKICEIRKFKAVFFDFDGVIKDSVESKAQAFSYLFNNISKELNQKITNHHILNTGISRFDKIPIYMKWAGIDLSQKNIINHLEKFSEISLNLVEASPWIPGSLEYIENNHMNQSLFIISATPQKDIQLIAQNLKIDKFFESITGSPLSKIELLSEQLTRNSINPSDAIMIGDSLEDYEAAIKNSVPFLLVKNKFNKSLQKNLDCNMISNFVNK